MSDAKAGAFGLGNHGGGAAAAEPPTGMSRVVMIEARWSRASPRATSEEGIAVSADLGRRSLLTGGGAAVAAAAAAVGASVINASPAAAAGPVPLYLHLPYGPERVYDSRSGDGKIARNETWTLGGLVTEPDTAAHNYNLTITGTTGPSGFLSLFPGDQAWPGSSSINWFAPGQTFANNAITGLASVDSSIHVRCGGASSTSSTHFILDLMAIILWVDLAAFNPAEVAESLTSAQASAGRQFRRL